MTLAAAAIAIKRADYGAARDALVAAWKVRRSPAIADLVDLLDPQAPDTLTAQLASIVASRVTPSLAAACPARDVCATPGAN